MSNKLYLFRSFLCLYTSLYLLIKTIVYLYVGKLVVIKEMGGQNALVAISLMAKKKIDSLDFIDMFSTRSPHEAGFQGQVLTRRKSR